MRANNKFKEVIWGTKFYTIRFYPKRAKQRNTIKILLLRTWLNEAISFSALVLYRLIIRNIGYMFKLENLFFQIRKYNPMNLIVAAM